MSKFSVIRYIRNAEDVEEICVNQEVVNVERDDENNVTIYGQDDETGKMYYICISQELIDQLKNV